MSESNLEVQTTATGSQTQSEERRNQIMKLFSILRAQKQSTQHSSTFPNSSPDLITRDRINTSKSSRFSEPNIICNVSPMKRVQSYSTSSQKPGDQSCNDLSDDHLNALKLNKSTSFGDFRDFEQMIGAKALDKNDLGKINAVCLDSGAANFTAENFQSLEAINQDNSAASSLVDFVSVTCEDAPSAPVNQSIADLSISMPESTSILLNAYRNSGRGRSNAPWATPSQRSAQNDDQDSYKSAKSVMSERLKYLVQRVTPLPIERRDFPARSNQPVDSISQIPNLSNSFIEGQENLTENHHRFRKTTNFDNIDFLDENDDDAKIFITTGEINQVDSESESGFIDVNRIVQNAFSEHP